MLSLRGVTKRFGARTVLNSVSLDVAAAEYVAIIGESGIGKSTLLRGTNSTEKARAAIAAVGLAGREASPPREVSGRRAAARAIARALVGEPKLVLADELGTPAAPKLQQAIYCRSKINRPDPCRAGAG